MKEEILALMKSVERWKHILKYQPSFLVYLDVSSLGYIVSITSEESMFPIENRIYREELKESLGMNFLSPFQSEREFKVYKSCKCSQIIWSRVH